MALVLESSHPYTSGSAAHAPIAIAGASAYEVGFDERSETLVEDSVREDFIRY